MGSDADGDVGVATGVAIPITQLLFFFAVAPGIVEDAPDILIAVGVEDILEFSVPCSRPLSLAIFCSCAGAGTSPETPVTLNPSGEAPELDDGAGSPLP